jgi:ribosome-associated protein
VTATDRAVELVTIAARAAADKLATDIIAYDVSEQLVITDAFLLCSAANDRQVKAIVDEIEDKLRKAGAKPVRREGEREGRWVLLDYLDVVIHVQHAEERVFYALERLWKDCPVIPLPEPVIAGGARGSRGLGSADGQGGNGIMGGGGGLGGDAGRRHGESR